MIDIQNPAPGVLITCNACGEAAVSAPEFEREDGSRIDFPEADCGNCGQKWQFLNCKQAVLRKQKDQTAIPAAPPVPGAAGEKAERQEEPMPPKEVISFR